MSKAVKVGTRIAFVSGPLVGMEGQVLQVNRGRRLVKIGIGDGEDLFRTIWCSIEYVQQRDETKRQP